MGLKDQIKNAIDTDTLADVFADFIEEESNSAYLEEPLEAIPDKLEKRFARIVDMELQPIRRRPKRFLVIAAALILALGAIQASAIPSKLQNYFIQFEEKSVDISENPLSTDSDMVSTEIPIPAYIPTGYTISSVITLNGAKHLVYQRGVDELRYSVYLNPSTIRLDTENANRVEPITVKDIEGIFIRKGNCKIIFWDKHPSYLVESELLDKDELLKIAESVPNLTDQVK